MRKLQLKLWLFTLLMTVGGVSSWAQSWTGNAPAAGTFLIYNVAAQKFINNGDPAQEWGTNAYLQAGFGLDIKFELNNGAYNLNTNVSNGGNNHYLATSTWCDGAATPWTFTAVDGQTNTYTISNGNSYLVANDALNDIVYGASTGDNKSWWKLVSLQDFKNAMIAKEYSTTESMDVSVFIQGRSFARNDGRNGSWTTTHNGGNWTWIGGSANKYYGNESWNNTFSVSQTITDLPNGVYEVQCSGFGTNGTTYIFGNSTSKAIQSDNTTARGTNAAAKWTAIHEDNAFAGQTTGTFLVKDGKITLGLKRETNNGGDWAIWDEFRLYYYGLDLSAYETEIASLRNTLNGLKDETMNATVKASVTTVLSETESVTRTEEAMNQAITALEAAIASANASIAVYATVKTYLDKVATLDAAGQAAFAANETAGTIKTAYEALTLETVSDEQKTALEAAVIAAAKAQTTEGADMTLAIVNPGFELGNTNGWTVGSSNDTGARSTSNNTYAMTNSEGNYLFNTWSAGLPITQTITDLREGFYRVTVVAARDEGTVFLLANGSYSGISCPNKNTGTEGSIKVAVTDGSLTIGAVGGSGDNYVAAGGDWYKVDNFRLTYVNNQMSEEESEEILASVPSEKMKASVKSALDAAVEQFKADKTISNYQVLSNAINAAKNSIAAYAAAATAINKANTLKTAHNFASATAITTFAEAIATISDSYNNGTLADDDANNAATTLGVGISGWHGNANGAAVKYMNDGFSLTDFDAALYVNTWSNEGASDGSNFEVPFYEYWVANEDTLNATTWTGTLTGLPNGLYSVKAWVRVRVSNAAPVADATDITMNVNGGAVIDLTEGEQVGESQFLLKEYTAEGLVKDGTLNLNFVIGEDNNISWLSFKNVYYTKVRDLTPEEAAIVPTAIALKNGEDVVTEVTLNATANTVTLTPSYTPANASEGYIIWTTSNPEVATVVDGVVTGVLPGTATITVTSTLAPAVSGSVTVTVTYPESDVPETYYVNNNATRTVYTLGENLIKNGSFEYPTSLYGWTASNDYTTAASASNFTITSTGGVNDGTYVTGNGVGADKAGSLTKLIAVEAGKTYYFSVYTSGKAPNSDNQKYNALFKLKSDKKEDGTITKFSWPQGADKTTSEWSKTEYIFTADDSHPYVGIRLSWAASANFDEFVLAEVVSETTEGNVDYAKAAIPTANIGNGVFQYSQEAINATGANELVQGISTAEEVQTAYDALQNIELNAPADGQLFNVVLTSSGWTYDQKAMTYIANGRSDGGKYNIQYKEAANQNLAQAFTFTKVEKNNYKMSQIDADGVARYISTGVPYGGNTSQIRTVTDAESALSVTVIPTATEGVWNLKNTAANQYIGSQDAGVFTVNSHIDFNIIETTKPEIAINTTAVGWGTVMLPFAQALPNGVKAYSCAATSEDRLTLTEVDALEANKPYLVEGAWDNTVTGDAQGTALTYTDGLFTGVYAAQAAPVGSYVLQKKGETLGFYKVADGEGKQPTVKANRAYLTVPASARVAFFFGEEGETTSISALQSLSDGNVEIYNTNGVRIPSLQKGMNILKMSDGKIKKVMVK